MTTAATAAYTYRATNALPLYALKRRKAQKQRGFRAKSTYGHCIKDEVLIDTARVSGLDVMYSLNLLTTGAAEPVAECQPRICDGGKPDIQIENRTLESCRNRFKRKQLDRCPTKISDQDTDQVNDILG
ncbi:hypothetical protein [Dialister hominis]|uniref:hypothetical protein n=1 Tax=Dialister hominis TaxID=2582419 RepID=UPI004026FD9E